MSKEHEIIDSVEKLEKAITKVRKAQEEFSKFTEQEYLSIGNHEQYFYEEYYAYDPEYEQKIYTLSKIMSEAGFECIFFEDVVKE